MRFNIFTLPYPAPLRTSFIELLSYTKIKIEPANFLGFFFLFSFLFSLLASFVLAYYFSLSIFIFFLASFFLIQLTFYLWLVVITDKRARFIEEVLPDALLLMSSNLRAGLTIDKAFLLSARPEFGPLQEEILRLGKEVTAGKEIGIALLGITRRVRSRKLSRALQLISSGLRSGGKLADLLQETALDFKNQRLVDRKIRASVNMYVIFIFVAISFGAPLLFGLSSYLVEILNSTFKDVDIPTDVLSSYNIPLSIQKVSVDPSFILGFAIFNLIFSSFFGALLIGLISKGREKDGIKYIPVLILLSIGLFFLIRISAQTVLSGLFG